MSSTDTEQNINDLYESLSKQIITEVKKRPALYDSNLSEYREKSERARTWEEVYKSIYKNWEDMPEIERKMKGNLIHKKWKNMRDRFGKELAMHRRKSGKGTIKKRKYIHFDALSFLTPFLHEKARKWPKPEPDDSTDRTNSNTDITNFSTDKTNFSTDEPNVSTDRPNLNTDINFSTDKTNFSTDKPNFPQTVNNLTISSRSKKQSKDVSYEQQLLDILSARQNTSEYDEDVDFSRMLVPMLRKLNDDQKHFARIEILNALQKAKYYNIEPMIYDQESRSYAQTPSPHSSYQIHSPESMSPTVSDKLRKQKLSTRKHTEARLHRRRANQDVDLPIDPLDPLTSETISQSPEQIDQPEMIDIHTVI